MGREKKKKSIPKKIKKKNSVLGKKKKIQAKLYNSFLILSEILSYLFLSNTLNRMLECDWK